MKHNGSTNLKGAASYLGVKQPTLSAWIKRGWPMPKYEKVGRYYRFQFCDLDQFLEEGRR